VRYVVEVLVWHEAERKGSWELFSTFARPEDATLCAWGVRGLIAKNAMRMGAYRVRWRQA